jgi:hypothetical protein
MATTDPLPDEAAAAVAAQVAAFLPTAAPDRELTESFAVCPVTAEQVRRPPADLAELVRPSGLWHHQVRTGAAATHFARSALSGFDPAEPQVQSVFESPIAGKIDEAITWADRNVRGRATVRLMVVPAYYAHALVIVPRDGEPSAVLADQPEGFKQLEYRRQYPLKEFLKLLAKEKPGRSLT